MLENYVAPRRDAPLHAPAQPSAGVEESPKTNGLQQDAVASNNVQLHLTPPPEEFTISVEQVREHFRSKGVAKSKDTVQRWCRTGELTCQKRGVLNRYFTTEASLKKLEQKILPDMIAETSGEAKLQVDAAANTPLHTDVQVHAGENAAARSGNQQHADREVQVHPPTSVEPTKAVISNSELSRLEAENEGLRKQIESRDGEIEFLREEVRAARDQRGAVVQISNRMLETLETMAVGGRLERPKQTEPVAYSVPKTEGDRV